MEFPTTGSSAESGYPFRVKCSHDDSRLIVYGVTGALSGGSQYETFREFYGTGPTIGWTYKPFPTTAYTPIDMCTLSNGLSTDGTYFYAASQNASGTVMVSKVSYQGTSTSTIQASSTMEGFSIGTWKTSTGPNIYVGGLELQSGGPSGAAGMTVAIQI